ncbi:unnamed protein product [Lathyrus sativus]|nr:unnamed protein product [Lathyrus sativus]CAK8065248.1 unnamed protein product [Lathyrus sativus]
MNLFALLLNKETDQVIEWTRTLPFHMQSFRNNHNLPIHALIFGKFEEGSKLSLREGSKLERCSFDFNKLGPTLSFSWWERFCR